VDKLVKQAAAVLKQNDQGEYTVPSTKLYPHQWLWDSCFIAIGLRHLDPRRAATELESLIRGQWRNGMMPNIVLSSAGHYWAGSEFWHSSISEYAPPDVPTSGITQPPMLAIAALAVSKKLPTAEAHLFLKQLFPHLVSYHQWLYRERDPQNRGLVALVNPWESGMDNSAPWMETIKWLSPAWIGTVVKLRLDGVLERRRKDTQYVPGKQRPTGIEALKLFHLAYKHKGNHYDSAKTLTQIGKYCLEDVGFNSILIRANQALAAIADEISEDLPYDLNYSISRTPRSLEELWDETSGLYLSRNFQTQKHAKAISAASFLPLFAGSISKERAKMLVEHLTSAAWWPKFPVPTSPMGSKYFNANRYWQGPSWINLNWLIIKGLKSYGFNNEADQLRQASIRLVKNVGFHEYFNALDGKGLGIDTFSWTAALAIDLLN